MTSLRRYFVAQSRLELMARRPEPRVVAPSRFLFSIRYKGFTSKMRRGTHFADKSAEECAPRDPTLKISISEGPEVATVKLEGRVAGPWVDELKRAWHELSDSLGSKKLKVDLRGVLHVSPEGRQMLAEIHRRSGAEFIADTPMTKYLADEASGMSHKPEGDDR